VPSLEHNGEVKGESLDLIKYLDSHFEGPALLPEVRLHQRSITFILAYHLRKKNTVTSLEACICTGFWVHMLAFI
jgi:glutathione S-transferase